MDEGKVMDEAVQCAYEGCGRQIEGGEFGVATDKGIMHAGCYSKYMTMKLKGGN